MNLHYMTKGEIATLMFFSVLFGWLTCAVALVWFV